MKGIILAGGTGSRLYPVTKVVNKHVLPVYDKPMIFYPLFTLIDSGIREIMIVTNPKSLSGLRSMLGNGGDFGVEINYALQHKAGGIADALSKTKSFCEDEKFVVILGDNIIEDNIKEAVEGFEKSEHEAAVFLKRVKDARPYGVAEVKDDLITNIEEKPLRPKSDLAVVGCYFYSSGVFDVIRKLKPSERGEMEITDVNTYYLDKGDLHYHELQGYWKDCGETFESLFEASAYVRDNKLMREHSGVISKVVERIKSEMKR